MGVAKRSLSPDAHEEDNSNEESSLPSHSVGQLDIRSFSSMKSISCSPSSSLARARATVLCSKSISDAEDVVSTQPLLKLPGQKDIRKFFKPYSESVQAANEEAAIAMGLSLGMESDEEIEDVQIAREAEEMDLDEVFRLTMSSYDAAEEAAIAMGLSFSMSPDMGDDMDEVLEEVAGDMTWSYHLQMEAAEDAARNEADEEAAQEMGLSLCLDSEDDAQEIKHVDKKARVETTATPNPATPPKRALAAKTTDSSTPLPKRALAAKTTDSATPLHDAKKRRVVEGSQLGQVCDGKMVEGKALGKVANVDMETQKTEALEMCPVWMGD